MRNFVGDDVLIVPNIIQHPEGPMEASAPTSDLEETSL